MQNAQSPSRFSRYVPALLAGAFVLSRIAFFLVGVRFDLRPLDTSWQILDPVLLRERLLESLFFMSGQPPLYNLVLGVALKLFGQGEPLRWALQLFYASLSLTVTLLLYALMRGLRLSRAWSAGCAALYMLSPALILYESIPYYTVMEVVLLTAICLLAHRLFCAFTFGRAFALFACMATLIYVRSMFQLYWLLVLLCFCLYALPRQRLKLLQAAALPVALVLALYGKNLAVTGHFGSSHWLGLSAIKLSCLPLPLARRQELVAQGKLSPMALKASYETPERLPEYFENASRTGVPVLDEGRKSTGHVNYNALPYVQAGRDSLHDALYAMRHEPQTYLRSIRTAAKMFFRPASDYPFLKENRDAIGGWSRLYARLVAGQPVYPEDPWFDYEAGSMGYLLMLAYGASVLLGGHALLRCFRQQSATPEELTLAFMWLQVMYVSVIGNAFEVQENQRFRFTLHPLLITMSALALHRALARWQARRARAPGGSELRESESRG